MAPSRRHHPGLLVLEILFLGGQTLWCLGRWIVRNQRSADIAFCQRGHPMPLLGVWLCPFCRAPFEGHVLKDRCPICHAPPTSWVRCATCHLPIRRGRVL